MAIDPKDPDAALHGATPGKFKPAAVAPAADPDSGVASPPSSGTLADTVTAMPDMRPVTPTAAPIEDPSSLSAVFHASSREAQRDSSVAEQHRLVQGWAPITQALGLDPSENPGTFDQLDEAGTARFGNAGSRLSSLATDAGIGELVPFTNKRYADRTLQEVLAVNLIKKRRQTQPNFLPGIPDTVEGIHKYFLDNEAKASAADQATIAKGPGGVVGTLASIGGGAVGTFHDPMNIVTLAIPGGEGKGLLQIAARDAMINGVLELAQQPIAAHNRHELGQDYTVGEGAENVAMAALGGAAFGAATHVGVKAAMATGIPQKIGAGVGAGYNAFADKLFAAMPDRLQKKWGNAIVNDWARRLAKGEKLDDVFSSLNNRELTTLSRTLSEGRMTPDEAAAGNVLDRSQDVAESSPYHASPTGEGTHEGQLADTLKAIIEENHRPPEAPSSAADAGAGMAAPERPPAPSSTDAERPQHIDAEPRRFAVHSPDGEAAIASFKAKVGGAENNTGNIHAKNPRSSASGNAQFTDPTFRDYYKKVYGTDPGEHPARELKDDPQVQAHLLDRLTHDNAGSLQRIGEAVNEGNLYLMHFAGSGDGAKILKADPATPIERIVSEKVLESNPFLRGKSASEVVEWAHKKMGGHAASVPPASAAGELSAATDDPMVAQLRAEALQLDEQVAGLTRAPDGSPINLYTRSVPSSAIGVDASRFQFKSGGDEFGVTDRLKGVKEWDAGLAGRATLWEDDAGKLWLADGHQRHGLARRISGETGTDIPLDAMILRSRDGVSAEDARVWAALKNIAEGTGSPIDAAKVLRDGGEHLLDRLPPKSALVRDGAALSRLSDDAFGAVYNERIPADQAAVIGHLLPNDPEKHAPLVDLLIKSDPANRAQAQSIVRQALAAGFDTAEQIDLFGKSESVASLFADKAKIQERALAKLRKMRMVHNTAAKEADTLEKVGSSIARAQSEKEAQANAHAIAIVDRLAYRAGPVAEALGDAARELRAGGKLGSVVDRYAERIRELDLASLDRESAGDVGGGANPDGNGLEGDAREESASLFEEPKDQGQPSLTELERATERFSDPDGPAVQQQAKSLVHDLKAELEASNLSRRDRVKAATARLEGRGELRSIEPFPEEPGYHRFRYVAEDGTTVTGNYTVDGNLIEGFNIGDTNNKAALGPKELRRLFAQLHELHPEVKYIHGYRMSGARKAGGAGEQEIWLELGEHGAKLHNSDPRTAADRAAELPAPAAGAEPAPIANDADAPISEADADRLAVEFRDAVLPDGPPIDHDNRPDYTPEDDHHDAERIIDHAMNLVAMKRGKEISPASHADYDKLHGEIAKLLGETNNVDAAVKHATKAIEKGDMRVHEDDLPPVEEPKPMPKSTLIPDPGKTVKMWEHAGPVLSQAEAKARVEGWKAEAKRIGKESPPPPNHFIMSLFDSSGVWSQPYRDMGYHVLQLDLNLGHDLMQDIAHIQHAIDDLKAQGGHFAGVIAQPPCTTFAASGARWWEPRHNQQWSNAMVHMWGGFAAKEFSTPVEYNQFLVMVTQEYIARAKPDFFVIENPVGRIEEMAGLPKPKLAIQPHNFGDAYTKRTHLWGDFNTKLETADVSPKEEDGGEGSKMHKLRSRDEKDGGLRSQTPEGMAYAFALANRPGTEARALERPAGEAVLHGAAENPLDLGAQVDPGKSANDRQIGALAAASPMGAPRDKPTLGEIGLELFDKANQPEMKFQLDEHSEPMTAADLLKELEDDDKAIAALKGCL